MLEPEIARIGRFLFPVASYCFLDEVQSMAPCGDEDGN